MTEINKHVQALRDLLVAENEEFIADIERRAAAAGARGDLVNQRMHLADVARMRATPYPWEAPASGPIAVELSNYSDDPAAWP
jgi:hypothetical protein